MSRSPLCSLWLLQAASCFATGADAIVAADGRGQYLSVQEALQAAPSTATSTAPWTILIRPGLYHDLLSVPRGKRFVHLVGEDAEKTILTFHLHAALPGPDGQPLGTFRTATATIEADDFTAENLTFENSAGPVGQALAVRVEGDRATFRHCRFLGWQDTVLVNRGRQYFEDCYLAGHVDFIFGGSTAWFERCHLHCLRSGYLTAASTPENVAFGFVFSHCRLTAETPETRTWLGRPWRPFASVTFLETEMSRQVRPPGWHNWGKAENEQTARYAEYGSTGEGARPAERVPWARQLTAAEAGLITKEQVLSGPDHWQPWGEAR